MKKSVLFFAFAAFVCCGISAQKAGGKNGGQGGTQSVSRNAKPTGTVSVPLADSQDEAAQSQVEFEDIDEYSAAKGMPNFKDVDFVEFRSAKGKKMSYKIGEDSQFYAAERVLADFSMNRYETTYRLWCEVLDWALVHGYSFENFGQEGSEGVKGHEPTAVSSCHPVTCINWHDAIVWCNAFSEKQGLTPCYTYNGSVLRDSSDTIRCDLAVCDWSADGYRLPSESEWEYAARKTSSGMQAGNLVSGQEKASFNADLYAWTFSNAAGTHTVATSGTSSDIPGTGKANAAGLYDMSGNVLEFCWDWFADVYESYAREPYYGPDVAEYKVARGGSWSETSFFVDAGDRYFYDPNENGEFLGFRVCRSLPVSR